MIQERLCFGSCYHLYYPGNPQQAIFRLEEDYYAFLDLYRKYVHPIAYLYGYCLLPTHFHLLLRIKDKKKIEYVYSDREMLWGQFKNMFKAYIKYADQAYQQSGISFTSGVVRGVPRNKELICDLIVYIHQNPQIHGIVSDYRYWPFSSCYAYSCQDRRSMIAKEILLDPDCHRKIVENQIKARLRVMDCQADFDDFKPN